MQPAARATRSAGQVVDPRPRWSVPILDLIGGTPLLELQRLGGDRDRRAEIFAKLESRNPGGSVKDRTALGMVTAARESGDLQPGQLLVEPTAGNTGIGLALVGRALGHQLVVVMPARYSREKVRLCQALGARVVALPGESTGMRECRQVALELAAREGGLVLDQFENPSNPAIHERTTGPEIWDACGGRLDAVVLGVGTGGTLTGVTRALRRHRPDIEAWAVENEASILGGSPAGRSCIEGIGNTFLPGTFDRSLVTGFIRVSDADAFAMVRELAREEGLLAGGSSGAAAFAALQVARRLGPGRRVVTLVADGGERYCSQGLYGSD